jgi:hypothetical protein
LTIPPRNLQWAIVGEMMVTLREIEVRGVGNCAADRRSVCAGGAIGCDAEEVMVFLTLLLTHELSTALAKGNA